MDVTLHFSDTDWPHVAGYCCDRLGIGLPHDPAGQAEAVEAVLTADGLAGAASFFIRQQQPPAAPVQASLDAAHQRMADIQAAAAPSPA